MVFRFTPGRCFSGLRWKTQGFDIPQKVLIGGAPRTPRHTLTATPFRQPRPNCLQNSDGWRGRHVFLREYQLRLEFTLAFKQSDANKRSLLRATAIIADKTEAANRYAFVDGKGRGSHLCLRSDGELPEVHPGLVHRQRPFHRNCGDLKKSTGGRNTSDLRPLPSSHRESPRIY